MEDAIKSVVKVFIKSSKGKETLGQKEFQGLVKSNLGNILSGTESKEAINNMRAGLDGDQDGKVGFEEYLKLVGYLACSLSEERNPTNEEPEQNAATGQVAQSAPGNKEEQPKENAEGNEEVKPKAKADTKVEVKVEAKAEGEAKPEAAKEEAAVTAKVVAASPEVAAVAEVKVAEKEPKKVEETEKVEEAAEKSSSPAAAAAEAEVKKTEEATS